MVVKYTCCRSPSVVTSSKLVYWCNLGDLLDALYIVCLELTITVTVFPEATSTIIWFYGTLWTRTIILVEECYLCEP